MASKKVLIEIGVVDKNATKQIDQVNKSVSNLGRSAKKVQKMGKDPKATAGIDNAILMETSRLASDASFGFTAIANNLSQLINLFKVSKDATGSYSASLRNLLKIQSLFLIAVQLLITFLPKLIKAFSGSESAVAQFNKKMAEATASVAGQNENIRSLQSALNDISLSYAQKQTILEKLRKEQGLQNAALDSSGKLNRESNELIQKSIKLNILQAKAKAAQTIIDNKTRETLEEIAKVRQKENTGLNKFMTLVATVFEPVVTVIDMTIDAFRGAVANLEIFLRTMSGLPVVGGQFQALADIISAYGKAVDSQEQKERRANKTREKISELNKKLAESTSLATSELNKINKEIAQLEATLPKIEEPITGMSKAMEASVQRIKDFGKALRDEIGIVTNIREDFFKLNQQETFQQMSLASQEKYYINLIEKSTALEAQKDIAISEVQTYFAEIRKQRRKKENEDFLKILADGGEGMAQLVGEQTAVGKALSVSSALISTYLTAQRAYESQFTPIALVDSPIRAKIAAALAVASGLANVRQILSVNEKGQTSISAGSGSRGGTVQAPAFNIVGASASNQLARTIRGSQDRPLRAFVVASDLTEVVDENNTNTETSKI